MATLAELLALLPDNTTGEIDAADMREIVTELWNRTGPLDSILFDTTPTPGVHTPGTMRWDSDTGMVEVDGEVAGTTLQVGQEMWTLVHNASGATIPNGSPVRLSTLPAINGRPLVLLDNAFGDIHGVATHDIANGANGVVTSLGLVHGINTSAFGSGVHVHATSTGTLTSSVTESFVGIVVTSHATEGDLLVRPARVTRRVGNTAARPTMIGVGFEYFDVQLNHPIWWTAAGWVDATGTLV
jgi:Uncharacterized conserved protein (DUF2190)